jgi:hypothetical protein
MLEWAEQVLVSLSEDGTLCLWAVNDGRCRVQARHIALPVVPATHLEIFCHGRYVSIMGSGTSTSIVIDLWNMTVVKNLSSSLRDTLVQMKGWEPEDETLLIAAHNTFLSIWRWDESRGREGAGASLQSHWEFGDALPMCSGTSSKMMLLLDMDDADPDKLGGAIPSPPLKAANTEAWERVGHILFMTACLDDKLVLLMWENHWGVFTMESGAGSKSAVFSGTVPVDARSGDLLPVMLSTSNAPCDCLNGASRGCVHSLCQESDESWVEGRLVEGHHAVLRTNKGHIYLVAFENFSHSPHHSSIFAQLQDMAAVTLALAATEAEKAGSVMQASGTPSPSHPAPAADNAAGFAKRMSASAPADFLPAATSDLKAAAGAAMPHNCFAMPLQCKVVSRFVFAGSRDETGACAFICDCLELFFMLHKRLSLSQSVEGKAIRPTV